jgi:hypothetical protein
MAPRTPDTNGTTHHPVSGRLDLEVIDVKANTGSP